MDPMKCAKVFAVSLLAACFVSSLSAAEPEKLKFDAYSGYFVSNKFEPEAEASFVVATTEEQFNNVFGVAAVMRDRSHRLSKDAFKANIVLSAIKRGKALWEFRIDGITVKDGVVEFRYTTTEKKIEAASYACPVIVSIPKGKYKAIQFIENSKPVKTIEMPEK
jgi:hypothetical protein